jgi:hypothetical protein
MAATSPRWAIARALRSRTPGHRSNHRHRCEKNCSRCLLRDRRVEVSPWLPLAGVLPGRPTRTPRPMPKKPTPSTAKSTPAAAPAPAPIPAAPAAGKRAAAAKTPPAPARIPEIQAPKPLGTNGTSSVPAAKPVAASPAPSAPAAPAPKAAAAKPVKKTGAATAAPKRSSGKKGGASAQPPTADEIGLRAYFIHEKRQQEGRHADPADDWVEAERQLLAERGLA